MRLFLSVYISTPISFFLLLALSCYRYTTIDDIISISVLLIAQLTRHLTNMVGSIGEFFLSRAFTD